MTDINKDIAKVLDAQTTVRARRRAHQPAAQVVRLPRLSRDPEMVAGMKAAAEAKRQWKNAKRIASSAAKDSGNG